MSLTLAAQGKRYWQPPTKSFYISWCNILRSKTTRPIVAPGTTVRNSPRRSPQMLGSCSGAVQFLITAYHEIYLAVRTGGSGLCARSIAIALVMQGLDIKLSLATDPIDGDYVYLRSQTNLHGAPITGIGLSLFAGWRQLLLVDQRRSSNHLRNTEQLHGRYNTGSYPNSLSNRCISETC